MHAIDLDPNYADADAALVYSHCEAVISGWSEFRAEELERAEAVYAEGFGVGSDNDVRLPHALPTPSLQETLRRSEEGRGR